MEADEMADADPTSMPAPAVLDLERLPTVELDRIHLAEHKIVGSNSRDSRSRAFNLLRTRLVNILEGHSPRLVGITSATPAAGKSFISANVAMSLAKVAEGPVILVDLDLRRGSVATELGLDATRGGVSDFLAGEAKLQDIAVRVADLPLTVLPTQVVNHESAELLVGDRFISLVGALRRQAANAVVLFDLPPVFANDDAMLSIGHLDGYILVVDSTETSKAHVQEAMSMLAPGRCLGTVLNRYTGRMFEKYGYGSYAYAKYYESQ
jgi:Mrp family chromosome partitioning ATPase